MRKSIVFLILMCLVTTVDAQSNGGMRWMLVVLVKESPIKTDLVFKDHKDCLTAEAHMRRTWSDLYNQTVKEIPNLTQQSKDFMFSQITHGTCVPTK